MKRKIYLIGSLRNPDIQDHAEFFREAGHEVFDDWYAAGEKADDAWQAYEQTRGRAYYQAINSVDGLLAKTGRSRAVSLADGIIVRRSYQRLEIEAQKTKPIGKYCHKIKK